MQRSPSAPATPQIRLPPLELGGITNRLRKENRPGVISSAPGSRRRSLIRLSRGSTPRRHSISNIFDDETAPYTPTRAIASSRRLSEILGERRRRSSMYLSKSGDTVFQTDYVGPINMNYLRYLCKVTLQEKEYVDNGEEVNIPLIKVHDSASFPRKHASMSPIKKVILASKFLSPLSNGDVEDYNESLPLPSDADVVLKSPDTGLLHNQYSDENIDYDVNIPVIQKVEILVTPPPKKLSFLERILQTQRNSHKVQEIRTPERDPMEIHRINNDIFMISEDQPGSRRLSEMQTLQQHLDAGVIDNGDRYNISLNGDDDNNNSGDMFNETSNVTLPRISITSTSKLTNDTPITYVEDHQSIAMPMATPSPGARTEFNDNFSPSILVDNEYTIDPESGSDNEISKLLRGQNDENQIESENDHHELSGLRSPILLPPQIIRHEGLVPGSEATRITTKQTTINKVPGTSIIPNSMIRTLVKNISLTAYGLDYPATKKRKSTRINKNLFPLIQELSTDFLSGLIGDLDAYAAHRKGTQISMRDLSLYTKRLNSTNQKLNGNRIPDTYNLDSIMLAAQRLLPLEILNELQDTLDSEGMSTGKRRKLESSESWLLDEDEDQEQEQDTDVEDEELYDDSDEKHSESDSDYSP